MNRHVVDIQNKPGVIPWISGKIVGSNSEYGTGEFALHMKQDAHVVVEYAADSKEKAVEIAGPNSQPDDKIVVIY